VLWRTVTGKPLELYGSMGGGMMKKIRWLCSRVRLRGDGKRRDLTKTGPSSRTRDGCALKGPVQVFVHQDEVSLDSSSSIRRWMASSSERMVSASCFR
jgi:hypothetical protein